MITADGALRFILELVAYGGGGAAVAYLTFQFLGKRWIEARFTERLEHLKHQQALELQRLRVEIDSLLSAAIKLQEREFAILPAVWEKLNMTRGLVAALVSPMQSYPDFRRMSYAQLDEFLADSELSRTEKDAIIGASDRTRTYADIIFWHRLNGVRKTWGDLRDFVAANGIFMPSDMKTKLKEIIQLLLSAHVDKQVGVEAEDFKMQSAGWEKVEKQIEPLCASIEADIHARLRSHSVASPRTA